MRSRDIVEREDAQSKTEEEDGAERDEGPEGELEQGLSVWVWPYGREMETYQRDDLLLDERREGNELEEEGEVELQK